METIKGVRLSLGDALVDSLLGYLVVFIGLSLLMAVIIIVGKIMIAQGNRASEKAEKQTAAAGSSPSVTVPVSSVPKTLAPGSAGEVKIFDTDPRDAAMIMAIVANKLQKPLNELRFVSIKEVKE